MEAVVFIGIQGSGKSSFFKERFYDTHVRISRDLLRTAHRECEFLDTCLRTGQRFVVDKVNARREDREEYILQAKASGFRVVGYFFPCSPREAIARNRQRMGKANVPIVGILSAYKRLEVPCLEEGFEELYVVRLTSQSGFVLAKATEANLKKLV